MIFKNISNKFLDSKRKFAKTKKKIWNSKQRLNIYLFRIINVEKFVLQDVLQSTLYFQITIILLLFFWNTHESHSAVLCFEELI